MWTVLLIAYLLVGYMFTVPDNWKWYSRILAGVLWLPALLLVFAIVLTGNFKL